MIAFGSVAWAPWTLTVPVSELFLIPGTVVLTVIVAVAVFDAA
jgi:hypothetical protein